MKSKNYNNKKSLLKIFETIVLSILILSFLVLMYCIYVSIKGDFKFDDLYNAKRLSTQVLENVNSDNDLNKVNDDSDIIENVNKCIVGISKIKNKGNTIFLNNSAVSLGLGTGFIVSENGYIITNQHVAGDKLSSCYVTLEDGKTYTGNVIWSDNDIDLCILKINAKGLQYVNLGDSNNIRIAQKVYAIGNPIGFEFQRTVTSGIISALNRTIKISDNQKDSYMDDLIQTDATINPGNSGGPLINDKGEVIGINSVKITSAEGIGFASPINIIKPILKCLKENGEYNQPTIGIFAYDKNVIPYINQDLFSNLTTKNGIYIANVIINSPAEKFGLKKGDIITKIDNIELNKMSELRQIIYSKKPNDSISVDYIRNNKEFNINIILDKK